MWHHMHTSHNLPSPCLSSICFTWLFVRLQQWAYTAEASLPFHIHNLCCTYCSVLRYLRRMLLFVLFVICGVCFSLFYFVYTFSILIHSSFEFFIFLMSWMKSLSTSVFTSVLPNSKFCISDVNLPFIYVKKVIIIKNSLVLV